MATKIVITKGAPIKHTGQEPSTKVAKPGPRDAQKGPSLKGRK